MQQTCVECGKPGYLRNHPDCQRKRHARHMREWAKANPEKRRKSQIKTLRARQASDLGVDTDTLETLMQAPCDICGERAPESRKSNSAYVRRDTGAVVGTICHRCATGLGFFSHDVTRLAAAIALLTSERDYRTSE